MVYKYDNFKQRDIPVLTCLDKEYCWQKFKNKCVQCLALDDINL